MTWDFTSLQYLFSALSNNIKYMILDNFPKVLWINLDRSADRRKYMLDLIKHYDLQAERITAVDGTSVKTNLSDYCFANPNLSKAENACACSHLLALRYFLEKTDEQRIIIFEDDVSFEFLPFITYDWSQFESHLPKNYDLIQLAVIRKDGGINIDLTPKGQSTLYCSAAYLIKRSSAKRILEKYSLMNKGYAKRFNLAHNVQATADAIITNSGIVYSIPIFTYKTGDSTIHPGHIPMHIMAKRKQMQAWIARRGKSEPKTPHQLRRNKRSRSSSFTTAYVRAEADVRAKALTSRSEVPIGISGGIFDQNGTTIRGEPVNAYVISGQKLQHLVPQIIGKIVTSQTIREIITQARNKTIS